MEYLAKIIKGERSPNKQLWRYTFLDLKTDETDWFINNYRIVYIPNLAGKLELIWDKTGRYKIYQLFKQDKTNLTEEEEELLFYSQDQTDLDTKRLAKDLVRKRRAELTARQITKLIKWGHSRDEIAGFFEVSKRDVRRKKNPNIKPLQKAGRKRIMDRKVIYYLITYLSTEKATLKKMSDYLYNEPEINQRFSVSTIFLALKRIRYSWQVIAYRNPRRKTNFMEVIEFIEKVNELPPRQLLATDESGYPLNLAPKRAWGLKGEKVASYKSRWGKNYSLILVIRNVKKGGIIHWDLIKGSVGTDVFHNFLSNINNLPNNEKYYLLMDRVGFHKAEKVNKLLKNKNIEPRLIVASNPWLNPTELVFGVIKQYVRSREPETYEKLRSVVAEKIAQLQEEDMTKYFEECLNYDFIFKSGQ